MRSAFPVRQMGPRRLMTLPELRLWDELRGWGADKPVFRRQQPLGPYVLDFFCRRARLCVEVDRDAPGDPVRDPRLSAYLVENGVFTVRVSAAAIRADAASVGLYILELARGRSAPLRTASPAAISG